MPTDVIIDEGDAHQARPGMVIMDELRTFETQPTQVPPFPTPSKAQPHRGWAVALTVLVIILSVGYSLSLPGGLSLYTLGIAFGIAYQRSRICFTGAVRDPLLFRQTRSARAVLIMITVGSLVPVGLWLSGKTSTSMINVYPLGPHTILGAFMFGTGMVLAGGCVCGSVAQAGQGLVLYVFVLLGVGIGFRLGHTHIPWTPANQPGVTAYLPGLLGKWGIGLHFAALGLVYWWLSRLERRRSA